LWGFNSLILLSNSVVVSRFSLIFIVAFLFFRSIFAYWACFSIVASFSGSVYSISISVLFSITYLLVARSINLFMLLGIDLVILPSSPAMKRINPFSIIFSIELINELISEHLNQISVKPLFPTDIFTKSHSRSGGLSPGKATYIATLYKIH